MRLRSLLRFDLLLLLLSVGSQLAAAAQSVPSKAEPEPPTSFGTVTGHVYLAGSNAPARFARVALQPTEVKDAPSWQPGKPNAVPFIVYETDLNGGFHMDHVKPGAYYVVASSPGCMSPFAQFTKEELQKPSPEVARRLANAAPSVNVAPNATASITLQLQKGASLAGETRFDDGTSFPGADLSLERRGSDGKWSPPRATEGSATSNAEGHWELSGLPPGQYRVLCVCTWKNGIRARSWATTSPRG